MAQQTTISGTSQRINELCQVNQKMWSTDVVFSSMSPVAMKGQTVKAQINGITSSLLIDRGSVIALVEGDLWRKSKHDHEELELWTKQLVSIDVITGILQSENLIG